MKFSKSILFLFFSMALSSYAFSSEKNKEHNKQKPNILFILLDDLGKEWIANYDADDIETPTIDALAKQGMQFKNSWSMPQCTPSRVTIMTGQYPYNHGWVNHYDVPRWGHGANFDSEKNPSIAKIMQQAGYKTCVAGKWQINDFRLQPEAMIEHGFDDYCMWTGAEGGKDVNISSKRYWDPYIHTKEGSKTYKGQFGEDVFSDFIIDFMKKNKNDPMMIYYPMCLPHTPFTNTPLEPNVTSKMDKHKAMVRYTDFILKKLITALEDLGIRDNTIIIWTTDNGTAGSITGHRNGRAIKGGKTYLTENGVNAPLIINCPGKVPEGVITDALVDFSDMLPTFADLGGAKLPIEYKIDGKSFKPLILGEQKNNDRDWILSMGSLSARVDNGRINNVHRFRDRVLRDQKYKVFVDTLQQIKEIYNIIDDLEEINNLIESNDKEIKKALQKFQKIVNQFPSEDQKPKYTKLNNSLFDKSPKGINKSAESNRKRKNHSPLPNK